jgi:hypothetical protein
MTPLVAVLMPVALAGVSRFAVLVGQNEGERASQPLLFAEDDARKVHHVLTSLGGMPLEQAHLVLSPSRNQLLNQMASLRQEVAAAKGRGDQTVVVFYYSGHADAGRLQLGGTWLTWDELLKLLERTGGDIQLALIDACQSGQLTRSKGGTRAPGFSVQLAEDLDVKGQVVITSSSGDEASHESDEIGGSYFTHFLVSALSGAGDQDRDGRVTVGEAWRYVQRETIFETQSSRAGTQHPTYAWDLAGTGDVPLTDLGTADAQLHFPAGLTGRFAVFDRDRRVFVAEIELDGDEPRALSLARGVYLVQERSPTHLRVAELDLSTGGEATVTPTDFRPVAYEDDVAKGAMVQKARRAKRPHLTASAEVAVRSFADKGFAASYFPDTPALGVSARWAWNRGGWISADVLAGQVEAVLDVDDIGTQVGVAASGTSAGISGGVGTRRRAVSAAFGVRLAGISLQRTFDDPGIDPQQLFTVTPGVVGRIAAHPGPIDVALELRAHHLPYTIDDYDRGLSFTEALLSIGVRWP